MSDAVLPLVRPGRRVDANHWVMVAGMAALAGLLLAVTMQAGTTWRMPVLVLVGDARRGRCSRSGRGMRS